MWELVLANIIFLLVFFLTTNRGAVLKIYNFKTVLFGDLIGLSLIDYGIGLIFIDYGLDLALMSVLVLPSIFFVYFFIYKTNKNFSDSHSALSPGRTNGKLNLSVYIHWLYSLIQITFFLYYIIHMIKNVSMDTLFVIGSIVYLLSLVYDFKYIYNKK